MDKKIQRLLIILSVMLSIIIFNNVQVNAAVQIPDNYGAKGALKDTSITLEEALTYALQDEYLAQARYDAIIAKFGPIRPFTQIKEAEQRHIAALLPLFSKYNVKVPVNDAQQYIKTPNTLNEAFQAGVNGEIDNIAMYEKLASLAEIPQDVKAVFKQLGDASKNHLAAFKRGLR